MYNNLSVVKCVSKFVAAVVDCVLKSVDGDNNDNDNDTAAAAVVEWYALVVVS